MLKSFFLAAVLILGVGGCSGSERSPTPTTTETGSIAARPNIIFILVDDMGWNDLGYQGSGIRTPNIDALAASGMKLQRAYAYPICSPTRAALMTGQNPIAFGVDGPMENDAQLSADLTLLPEHLKEAGYDTWLVGKWHLGMGDVKAMPHNRGFDHFYGFLGGFVDFYTHVYFGGLDWQRNGTSLREAGFATTLLTDEAIALIDGATGAAPFFMYLSYNAPHTPLQYPPAAPHDYEEIANPDRRVYAQMLSDLDKDVGRVSGALSAKGIAENTLIVFMSDNGGNLEAGASNGDLRGGKGSSLEGGVRVPAFVVWPDQIEAGRSTDVPVFAQDWMPTLMHIAGSEPDPNLDGKDVWQALISDSDAVQRAPVILGTAKQKAVYDWPFKLVLSVGEGAVAALYDVVSDPLETTDLAADDPGRVAALTDLINELPVTESKAARGPPPEALFRDSEGNFIYDIRKPETREPWAESAVGATIRANAE